MNLPGILSSQADIIRNKPAIYKIGDEEIKIYPLTFGQIIAINPYIAQIQIEGEIKTAKDFYEKALPQLKNYIEPLGAIFKELIDYDFNKLLPIDAYNILLIILSQLGMEDFFNSIILTEKISRSSREELIAAEQKFSTPLI